MSNTTMEPSIQALEAAIKAGDEPAVIAAIKAGADVNYLRGLPLYGVASLGYARLVPILVAMGADVNAYAGQSVNALHRSAFNGDLPMLRALLRAGADKEARTGLGRTPLHVASDWGHPHCVRELIEAEADINATDKKNFTPLILAALGTLGNKSQVIDTLLAAGCDRNACNVEGHTALHMAAMYGNVEVGQKLIMAGLDIQARDANGMTPVDLAQVYGQHNAEWWLRKLQKPTMDSKLPSNVLMAISLKMYEDKGNKVLQWGKDVQYALLSNSIPHVRDGHYQDAMGLTVLHWVARQGNLTTARVLIEQCGVYPGVISYDRKTPVDIARESGRDDVAKVLINALSKVALNSDTKIKLYTDLLSHISAGDDVKEAAKLLCLGTPLQPIGSISTHALVLAVTSNRPRILTLLLAAGADLVCTSHGLSLLQLAWRSPDVTIHVKSAITRAFINVLKHETTLLRNVETTLPGNVDPMLCEGVARLVSDMNGATPWQATWHNNDNNNITNQMVLAVRANCHLTTFFLAQTWGSTFSCNDQGVTPLHAAIKAQHWGLAEVMVRYMEASIYIPDKSGRLPRDLMPDWLRKNLEEILCHKEKRLLEDNLAKMKDENEKNSFQEVVKLQERLTNHYRDGSGKLTIHEHTIVSLLVACQLGLTQMVFLLVTVSGMDVNKVLDLITGTSALHQAAAYGKLPLAHLLVSLGGNIYQSDRSNHTPAHLAAMFGHKSTYNYLSVLGDYSNYRCRGGTLPQEVWNNFNSYLERYLRSDKSLKEKFEDLTEINDPLEAVKMHLNMINIINIQSTASLVCVDCSQGEANIVIKIVMRELNTIKDKMASLDPTFTGRLSLLGSSADGTRLYAPDEFDVNLILNTIKDIKVKIAQLDKNEALLKGHKKHIYVTSEKNQCLFEGTNMKDRFLDAVLKALEDYDTGDSRLSLVPPGIVTSQVGVELRFSWQGTEYPLLLIGVDLVPVLSVPWPKDLVKPPLTPADTSEVFISSTGDGHWRFSFADTEVKVLQSLTQHERGVLLACKTLLSHLKADLWMPREIKDLYTWWDSRPWKLAIPSGFALKNAFLIELEFSRTNNVRWDNKNLESLMVLVFRRMCQDFQELITGERRLVPSKVWPYFGGEFEKPKLGEGAPQIVSIL